MIYIIVKLMIISFSLSFRVFVISYNFAVIYFLGLNPFILNIFDVFKSLFSSLLSHLLLSKIDNIIYI